MDASKFLEETKAVLLNIGCISGVKDPPHPTRTLNAGSKRLVDGLKAHSGPGPSSFYLSIWRCKALANCCQGCSLPDSSTYAPVYLRQQCQDPILQKRKQVSRERKWLAPSFTK